MRSHATAAEEAAPTRLGRRSEPVPASVLLLLAAVAAGVKAQGGFYAAGQVVLGGLVLLAAGPALRGARPGRGALAAALLGGWSLCSAAIAGDLGAGVPGAALVALLHAAHVVVVRLGPEHRRVLVDGLLVLGVVTALLGLAGVALHLEPLGHLDSGTWRAATTLTYENAAAGLLVPLTLVALATCRTPARRAAATVLGAGVLATSSRSGLLALLVGVVVLCTLAGPAVRRALPAPLLGAVVAAVGLLPSLPGTSLAHPVPALLALITGALLSAAWERVSLDRRLAARLAAGVLVGAIGIGAVPAVHDAAVHVVAQRLSVTQSDRVGESAAALAAWTGAPLTGVGPGTQSLQWHAGSGARLDRYAHDEYLQVLWKTGVVGLALLLVWLGVLLHPCSRGGRDPLRAGCLAGLAALAVASALDLLWHLPVIPLVGLVLAGVARPHSRPIRTTSTA